MPQPLDAAAVRRWCRITLDALGRAREDIDAINVYPVPDGDTGTNLYLTVESAAQAVEAADTASPTLAEAVGAMAHGALIGARGNSGTILAQLLRGMADVLAAEPEPAGPGALRRALRRAASSAYEAVAHPVEGTMLTVATAAADAAERAGDTVAEVLAEACAGAREALAATPDQLAVLADAGVVDAGGSGLVAVLDALDAALSGRAPDASIRDRLARSPSGGGATGAGCPPPVAPGEPGGFEVIYLLDAADDAVATLRGRLDALGDSLVVVGGDGLWHVHIHTADPGPAVEAGIEAGRPHRVRITGLAAT
ncbi:DAK2 domain-containing protein, partial [Streptomyces sp. SBT349]|uniref:DAK2 domain-containing protein n=1 Tax=Streptomyces sp. SBT349 TaxID=1580539 RepID=UPI00066A7D4F